MVSFRAHLPRNRFHQEMPWLGHVHDGRRASGQRLPLKTLAIFWRMLASTPGK